MRTYEASSRHQAIRYHGVLSVPFTEAQRTFIEHNAKRMRVAEAELIRRCVEHMRLSPLDCIRAKVSPE